MGTSKIWIFIFLLYGFLEVRAQTTKSTGTTKGTEAATTTPILYIAVLSYDEGNATSNSSTTTEENTTATSPTYSNPNATIYSSPSTVPSNSTTTASPNSNTTYNNSSGNGNQNPPPDYYYDDHDDHDHHHYHHKRGWRWIVVGICSFFIFTIFWIIFCKVCLVSFQYSSRNIKKNEFQGLCFLTCCIGSRPRVIYAHRVNPYDRQIYTTDGMGYIPPLPIQSMPMQQRPFTAPPYRKY